MTLPVDQLKPNMVLIEPIVTKRGQTIVKAGETLTPQMIAKLTFYKIESATVEDPVVEPEPEPVVETPAEPESEPAPPKAPSMVSDQITYTQRLKASPKFQKFQSDYALNITYLKENLEAICAGADAGISEMMLENVVTLYQSKTSLELLDMLGNMRNLEDPIYSHSLNVALIARSLGRWLQFSRQDLDILTVAGLVHDIGKTQIPESILNKPGKYTDEEFKTMKSHTILGKKILNDKGFDPRILYATLQHHERCDGSGYPRGLEEDEIDEFASIIGIADVYDAMTSARAHRDPLCPYQVISEFEKDGLKKYTAKHVLTFLERIANSYSNSRIMLNNAKTGRVVYINKSTLSRPVIQLDSGEIINLADSAYNDLFIKSIL